MLLQRVWKLLREPTRGADGKEEGKISVWQGKGTDVQNQVTGPKGPPSLSGKSHPLMHSNTHPLTEKWQSRASLKILGATVGRSQGKRTAASPRVLGGGEDRWGERQGDGMGDAKGAA